MKTLQFNAPAYWASYLINGDGSGLGSCELEAAQAFLSAQDVKNVLCCTDEPFYARFNGLGRDMLTYTAATV